MSNDSNVRTLSQILIIAKKIVDAGKDKEFLIAAANEENLFVVATDSSRKFISDFLKKNNINPDAGDLHSFRYGKDRC